MDLSELNSKLKAIADFEVEKEVYKFIKSDLEHLFLRANWEQIFEDGVDVDGDIIGHYKPITERIAKATGIGGKEAGSPFDMIVTGEFSASLKILTYYRHVEIYSGTRVGRTIQYSEKYLKIMTDTDANYHTKHFFGLTEQNLNKIIRKWILPMLRKKMLIQ